MVKTGMCLVLAGGFSAIAPAAAQAGNPAALDSLYRGAGVNRPALV